MDEQVQHLFHKFIFQVKVSAFLNIFPKIFKDVS